MQKYYLGEIARLSLATSSCAQGAAVPNNVTRVISMKFKRIPEAEWKPQPFPVELSQILRPPSAVA